MARHAACHRMDGVFDFNAFLLEQIGHFTQHLLRLRHRHAIARHHDDLLRILHHIGRVFRAAGLHGRAIPRRATSGHGATFGTEATQQHIDDAAVHALTHDVGQNGTRCAHQRAGHNQQQIANSEANACRRPAGIAIQHGHNHRHIRAADRDDQQEAQGEGQQCNQPEQDIAARDHEQHHQKRQQQAQPQVQHMLTLEHDGRARHPAIKLGEGNHRTRKGDGANRETQRHFNQRRAFDISAHANAKAFRCVERRRRHEYRRKTHQRMEGRHKLRERRHLNALRDNGADGAANGQARNHQPNAANAHARLQQGGGNRHRHADHAKHIALAAGFRMAQAAQRQDEQH